MYHQQIATKTSPNLPSKPIEQKITPTTSSGSLSGTIQRAIANPETIREKEWQEIGSAIGGREANEIKSGKRTSWEPEFKGISAQWRSETGQNLAPVQAKQTIGEGGEKSAGSAEREAGEVEQGKQHPIQKKENKTGLPDALKTGIENLSGYSMDDVKVHYNSEKPATLQAHAYAQGMDIHIAPGQEKHLPHEAWHVVQQMQGRVKPTMQANGLAINDDSALEREAELMGAEQYSEAEQSASLKQKLAPRDNIQGKFYYGDYDYSSRGTESLLTDLIELNLDVGEATIDKKLDLLRQLAENLWQEYGNSTDKHMEMQTVVRVNKKQQIPVKPVETFMEKLKEVPESEVDTPERFENRIKKDVRLSEQTRTSYIEAFKNRRDDHAKYVEEKKKVKEDRKRMREQCRSDAGKYLTDRNGGRHQDDAFKPTLEEIEKTDPEQRYKRLYEMVCSNTQLSQKSKDSIKIAKEKITRSVLEMKDDLRAAWYYNAANEGLIEAKEGTLKSFAVLLEEAKAERKESPEGTHTQKSDDELGTSAYFFGWIEHKDTEFKTHTRFTGKGEDKKAKPLEGKRIRYPLRKSVEAGGLIMADDWLQDRRRDEHMKLPPKDLEEEHYKIFGSRSSQETKEDSQNEIETLLKRYVSFVFGRIVEAINRGSDWTRRADEGGTEEQQELAVGAQVLVGKPEKEGQKGYLPMPLVRTEERSQQEPWVAKLEELQGKNGKELWEELQRYYALAQLMTPWMVSRGMRGITPGERPSPKQRYELRLREKHGDNVQFDEEEIKYWESLSADERKKAVENVARQREVLKVGLMEFEPPKYYKNSVSVYVKRNRVSMLPAIHNHKVEIYAAQKKLSTENFKGEAKMPKIEIPREAEKLKVKILLAKDDEVKYETEVSVKELIERKGKMKCLMKNAKKEEKTYDLEIAILQ